MLIEPEIAGASIVLIGNFNPKIFQPAWLAKHGLIPDKAADTADIAIIHSEVTSFSIESFFTIQVDQARFSIERTIAPLVSISDTTIKLFRELLPHVPISQMGINRMMHFNVGEAVRDRIGLLLAPREPWGAWGKEVSSGEGLKHGGLQSLLLIQKNLDDRPAGWIQAKVEPSLKIGNARTGIYMEVNDHFQITDTVEAADAQAMMKILASRFDESIRNSERIIDQIMSLKG